MKLKSFVIGFSKRLGMKVCVKQAATLEMRVRKGANSKGTSFADLVWKPRCLIRNEESWNDFSRHYRQAFTYWVNAVPDRRELSIV